MSSVPQTLPTVQKYESEIEKCIKLGLVDANLKASQGTGLPSMDSYKTKVEATAIVSRTLYPRNPQTIEDLPPERRPSSAVVSGLHVLRRRVHRASCKECRTRWELEQKWRALEDATSQVDEEARDKLAQIQLQWEELHTQFNAIGKVSRMSLRDELNRRWEDLRDLEDLQREINQMRLRHELQMDETRGVSSVSRKLLGEMKQ